MPVGTSAWVPLGYLTLGANAGSVTFSNIPATMRDLIVVVDGQAVTTSFRLGLVFNGDVGTTTYWESNMGYGGNSTQNNSNPGQIDAAESWSTWSNTVRSSMIAHVFDYAQTDKHKSVMVRSSAVASGQTAVDMVSGRWASTAAITSLKVLTINTAGYFMTAGTNVALYGVAA